MPGRNATIAVSEHNGGVCFDHLKAAVIVGRVHDATEGSTDTDPTHSAHRAAASARSRLVYPQTLCALVVICAWPITTARAFDSAEHCALSNLSARIAFDYIDRVFLPDDASGDKTTNALREDLKDARHVFLPFTLVPQTEESAQFLEYCSPHNWNFAVSKIPFSYGKFVSLVDYSLNPTDLFRAKGSLTQVPTSAADLSREYFSVATSKGHKAHFGYDLALTFRYWLAAHNNNRHFQDPTIESFYQLHEGAITAARSAKDSGARKSLFRALAYSASADHFLQDSFAPGHIVTPRDGMYDAVALSWHDAFNDRGRMLAVRHWSELSNVVDFVKKDAESPSYNRAFQQIGDSADKEYRRTTFSAALENLDASRSRKDPKDLRCSFHASALQKVLDPLGSTFTPILDLDRDLLTAWQPDHDPETDPPSICARGDGSLDEHIPRLSKEVSAQKALMVIVEAQYIIEVLEVYISHGKGSRAEEFQTASIEHVWCPEMSGSTSEKNRVSSAQLDTCEDLLEKAIAECKTGRDQRHCETTFMIPTAVSEYFAYVSSPSAKDELDVGVMDYRDWLYALHVGVNSANHHSAIVGGVELGIPLNQLGRGPSNDLDIYHPGASQTVAFIGFEGHGPVPHTSHAYTLRLVKEIPQIDLAIGPYVQLERLENGVESRNRLGFGARAELGFSVFSLYVALGSEPYLDYPLKTIHGFGITTGFTGVLNGRRLWDDTFGRIR